MMSSNIIIEMVDLVFERVLGVIYVEVKEVLVMCNGDVIEVVIYLENKKNICNCKVKFVKEIMEEVFGKDGENIKF